MDGRRRRCRAALGMADLGACGWLRSPEVSWLVAPRMGKEGGGCLSCKLKPYNICVK